MILQKSKLIAGACLASGLFVTGAGVIARQQATRPVAIPDPQVGTILKEPVVLKPAEPSLSSGAAEKPGISLPGGERNLHQELIQAGSWAYRAAKEDHHQGRGSLDRVHSTSRMLMEAERDAASSPTAKFDAVEAHFQRMREMARTEKESGKSGDTGATDDRFS